MVSSSETATIVSGVAGAGLAVGVVGGVVPVCGSATVVPRGAEVLVVVELVLLWLGVGGTISMKVVVAVAVGAGAPI